MSARPRIAGEPAARRAARRGRCSTPARARASSPGREAPASRRSRPRNPRRRWIKRMDCSANIWVSACACIDLGIGRPPPRTEATTAAGPPVPPRRGGVRFDVGGLLPREVVFHRIMLGSMPATTDATGRARGTSAPSNLCPSSDDRDSKTANCLPNGGGRGGQDEEGVVGEERRRWPRSTRLGGDATGNNARRGRCDSVVVVTGQRSM